MSTGNEEKYSQQSHGSVFLQLQKKKGKRTGQINQVRRKCSMAWYSNCKSPLLSQPSLSKACSAYVLVTTIRVQLFILS